MRDRYNIAGIDFWKKTRFKTAVTYILPKLRTYYKSRL